MSDVEDFYLERQSELAGDVSRRLMQVLATITLFRAPQVRSWYATETAATVSLGQWRAGELALSYLGSLTGFSEPPDLTAALAKSVMSATDPGAVVGLVRMWWLIDQGAPEAEAREQAGIFTAALARGDLQAAMRIGLDEGARVAERGLRWRKSAGPSACDWCQLISGEASYRHAYTVPFHRGCNCGVAAEFVQ